MRKGLKIGPKRPVPGGRKGGGSEDAQPLELAHDAQPALAVADDPDLAPRLAMAQIDFHVGAGQETLTAFRPFDQST